MRAAQAPLAPNVPLVLRIGVVRQGRIVEERVIKQRNAVSIGTSEDATFVCGLPTAKHELFARAAKGKNPKESGYVLRFAPGMTGRVALASEVTTLDALRARGIEEVALDDDSRGKVTVGETTFLFQFVRPPPAQARPQLPLAVKGGFANQIDWSLTIIAALSFLLHFGIVGAMYSDWMDVVVDDQRSIAGIVDMMHTIPNPVVETPAEQPSETVTPTPAPTHTESTSTSSGKTPNVRSVRTVGMHTTISGQDAAALAQRASQMELDLLAAANAKSSVENALLRSEVPAVDLSARAASQDGVSHSSSELHLKNGGPAVASKNNGLPGLAGDTHGNGKENAGDARTIAAPKVEPQIGALGGAATVTGADRVVAGLRGRFKACYQKGLNVDPNMSGKVVIAAKIGPNGEVISSDIASMSGLSPEVGACIASAVKRAQFDAQPGPTTLNVPVSFMHQN